MTNPEINFAVFVLFVTAILLLRFAKRTFWLIGVVVLLLFAIGLSIPAKSADLLLGQSTQHFHDCMNYDREPAETCKEPNDSQKLLGLATDRWVVIWMPENSLNKESMLLLRKYSTDWGAYLRPHLSVGVATGYESLDLPSAAGFTPTAYLSLDIHPRSDRMGIVVNWCPESFIGVGLRFKLGKSR